MLLLNSYFSLLGNTQTFIVAIATLCVLCFFRNNSSKSNSNFIELLIEQFNEKFSVLLQDKIAKLAANSREKFSFLSDWGVYHKSADEEDKQKLLEIQMEVTMVQNKLYNDSERNSWIKTKFDETQKPFQQKQSQGLMAYFTFILCILVLSFDVSVHNLLFAGWVLFFFDFILCIVILSTWAEYINAKPLVQLNRILNKKWIFIIVILVDLIFFTGFFWTNSYLTLFIALIISTILYYNRIISNSYNFVIVTKDIIYFVIATLFLSLLLCVSVRYSFIYINMPLKIQTFISAYNSNVLSITTSITTWGAIFAILCVLNAIIIPVFLTYFKGQSSLKDIKKEYEEKLKEVEIIKRNYENLKESINHKITPNKK